MEAHSLRREPCKFCDDYAWQKKHNRKFEDNERNDPDCAFDFRHRYNVALVVITQRRKKGSSAKFSDGARLTHGGYALHYCPVCGRKL